MAMPRTQCSRSEENRCWIRNRVVRTGRTLKARLSHFFVSFHIQYIPALMRRKSPLWGKGDILLSCHGSWASAVSHRESRPMRHVVVILVKHILAQRCRGSKRRGKSLRWKLVAVLGIAPCCYKRRSGSQQTLTKKKNVPFSQLYVAGRRHKMRLVQDIGCRNAPPRDGPADLHGS